MWNAVTFWFCAPHRRKESVSLGKGIIVTGNYLHKLILEDHVDVHHFR